MSRGLAARIARALDELPVAPVGPQPWILRQALAGRTDFDRCWQWPGAISSNGYGYARLPGPGNPQTSAHRVVWQLIYGPIPTGMQVDHLCHDPAVCGARTECPHRRCVNPTHLAVVTPRVNTLRSRSFAAVNAQKTACCNGHEFTPENTYVVLTGGRACRACSAAYDKRRRGKRLVGIVAGENG